jgi:hypothetical protein
MMGTDFLSQVLTKCVSQLIFSCVTEKFLQYLPIRIQEIQLRLGIKAKRPLKCVCIGVICIKKGELDSAKVFRFEPMNHGCHCAAGTSGEAKKLNQLQMTGGQIYCRGIGGFQVRSSRGGYGQHYRRLRWSGSHSGSGGIGQCSGHRSSCIYWPYRSAGYLQRTGGKYSGGSETKDGIPDESIGN